MQFSQSAAVTVVPSENVQEPSLHSACTVEPSFLVSVTVPLVLFASADFNAATLSSVSVPRSFSRIPDAPDAAIKKDVFYYKHTVLKTM